MTTKQIIDTWLNGRQKALFDNYIKLGLKASGDWGESLEQFKKINKDGFTVGILGNNYTRQLENGRSPNQNQSEEAVRKWVGWAGNTFIKQWVQDKGININPFAVAYKIAREGWRVPNTHNAGGLVSDVITKESIDQLSRELSLFYVDGFKSDVLTALK